MEVTPRWQNTLDVEVNTFIRPRFAEKYALFLKKPAGANQKFQKTDIKIPKLPEQFSENILTVPNRTLSCKLQVKFKSNAKNF